MHKYTPLRVGNDTGTPTHQFPIARVSCACGFGLRSWVQCKGFQNCLAKHFVAGTGGCKQRHPTFPVEASRSAPKQHLQLPRYARGESCFKLQGGSGLRGPRHMHTFQGRLQLETLNRTPEPQTKPPRSKPPKPGTLIAKSRHQTLASGLSSP